VWYGLPEKEKNGMGSRESMQLDLNLELRIERGLGIELTE
jgi:hypothetical protein